MSNTVPTVDVTEPTAEQALAEGRARVADLLAANDEFVMVSFGADDLVSVAAGCEDYRVIQALLALLTMLGHHLLGAHALGNLPPDVAQATAVAAGFGKLAEVVRAEASAAGRTLNS
jgi:hypothetical protein